MLSLPYKTIVDEPCDVIWSPLNTIGVVVCAWVKTFSIVVVLLTILPNYIHAKWIFCHTWNELDINLIPIMRVVLTVVSEKRGNSTHLGSTSHSYHKFTVQEVLL